MSGFTRNMQRRHRQAESGWEYNTPPLRDSVITPRSPITEPVDPRAAMGLALAAIEAAIDCHGTHSDPLGVYLHRARAQVHAALQALA